MTIKYSLTSNEFNRKGETTFYLDEEFSSIEEAEIAYEEVIEFDGDIEENSYTTYHELYKIIVDVAGDVIESELIKSNFEEVLLKILEDDTKKQDDYFLISSEYLHYAKQYPELVKKWLCE